MKTMSREAVIEFATEHGLLDLSVMDLLEILTRIGRMQDHSMLSECAYQGPPPKKWIQERTHFSRGYNDCARMAREIARNAR